MGLNISTFVLLASSWRVAPLTNYESDQSSLYVRSALAIQFVLTNTLIYQIKRLIVTHTLRSVVGVRVYQSNWTLTEITCCLTDP